MRAFVVARKGFLSIIGTESMSSLNVSISSTKTSSITPLGTLIERSTKESVMEVALSFPNPSCS